MPLYAGSTSTGAPDARSVRVRMALDDRARGQRIARLRKRKGLTQYNVAAELSVSHSAVQKWESGKVVPEPANLFALAALLDCAPDDIGPPAPERSVDEALAEPGQLDRMEAKLDRLLEHFRLGETPEQIAEEAAADRQRPDTNGANGEDGHSSPGSGRAA